MKMMTDKYKTLVKALDRIKEENDNIHLVKIYYFDEENFTIKGIDRNGDKCFTKRVCKDKSLSAFDHDFRERVGKYGQ